MMPINTTIQIKLLFIFFIICIISASCQSPLAEEIDSKFKSFTHLKLIKIIKTDKQPKQVCFHPTKNEMYVANMNNASGRGGKVLTPGSMQIFSLPDLKLIHKQKARTAVECLVDDDYLYYSDMFRDEVVKFDLNQKKVIYRIPIKLKSEKNYRNSKFRFMPKIIIRGPKNGMLTVSKWLGGISILDSNKGALITRIKKFCEHPRGLLYNEQGNLIVMCYGVPDGPGQILILDSKNKFKVIQKKITGGSPRHIVSSGSNKAIISNLGHGLIQEIDKQNLKTLRSIFVGGQPNSIVLDPDQRHLYISQRGKNTLTVLNLPNWKVVKKYKTGKYPTGLGISPNGKYIATTNFHDGTLSLFEVFRE